jgi:signal transduction histidine kinase
LAQELQSRQQELQQTNQELEEKAGLLAHQNQEVERKNQEVEQARKALEEKAEQLALTSKYKSEFLANMSHELRTPLNSLLILSDQLCKNPGGNLTDKQVEFAKTIHASATMLTLINDILDLSKIESGTVAVDPTDLPLDDLQRYVERTFRHVAEAKNVDFFIRMDSHLPPSMLADAKRLQQVLKNLLSNAFKFTQRGHVTLTVERVRTGWDPENENLNRAEDVIAFSVMDTGIGISPEKQQIIFEAFQQADGGTSRKYGGTGLGLAISRELARVLGGELRLVSAPRVGSTFTLYLPQIYTPPHLTRKSAPALTAPVPAPDGALAREAESKARAGIVARDRSEVERDGASRALAGSRRARQRGRRRPGQPDARRTGAADHRERPGFRALPARCRAREGLQGNRDFTRRLGPRAGGGVQAFGGDARSLPPRHRRLARARSVEARHSHATHPGGRDLDRRGTRARP